MGRKGDLMGGKGGKETLILPKVFSLTDCLKKIKIKGLLKGKCSVLFPSA